MSLCRQHVAVPLVPRSGSERGRESGDPPRSPPAPLRPTPALSRREAEARRTAEAIAQLKQKLVKRRPPPPANGGAGTATAAEKAAADLANSALVTQMAEVGRLALWQWVVC